MLDLKLCAHIQVFFLTEHVLLFIASFNLRTHSYCKSQNDLHILTFHYECRTDNST